MNTIIFILSRIFHGTSVVRRNKQLQAVVQCGGVCLTTYGVNGHSYFLQHKNWLEIIMNGTIPLPEIMIFIPLQELLLLMPKSYPSMVWNGMSSFWTKDTKSRIPQQRYLIVHGLNQWKKKKYEKKRKKRKKCWCCSIFSKIIFPHKDF